MTYRRRLIDRKLVLWEAGRVKATVEIDDDLYREAKAVAALSGRKIKDLVAEGLRKVLHPVKSPARRKKSDESDSESVRKLKRCFAMADELMHTAPTGRAARDLLAEDRGRLES